MKKINITIFLLISFVFIVHGQRINLYEHYMIKNNKNLFGHGTHLSLNLDFNDKIEIEPSVSINRLKFKEITNSDNSIMELSSTYIYYTVGTGVYYKILSADKFSITAGADLDLVHFPKIKPFFSDGIKKPKENKLYIGIKSNINRKITEKWNLLFQISYGLITKKLTSDFAQLKIGLGFSYQL